MIKKGMIAIVFIMTVMALTACGSSAPGPQEVYESYNAAMDNGDVEEALKYISDDATWKVPVGTLEGKDKIGEFFQQSIDMEGSSKTENCVVEGTEMNCDFEIVFGTTTVTGNLKVTVEDGLITDYDFMISQ